MNGKLLLLALVVVLLGSAVFFWQLWRPTPAVVPADVTSEETATSTPEEPVAGRGTLAELRALRRNIECSLLPATGSAADSLSEGTVFVHDGKIRGDFILKDESTTTVASMIIADNVLYTWSTIGGQEYGVKVDLSTPPPESGSLDAREPLSLDDEVRYECKPWVRIDNSVFAPPGTILFRDLGTIQEQGMEYGTVFESAPAALPESSKDSCLACAAIKDPAAKAVCKKELECR